MYVWNGFLILSKSPELLDPVLLKIEETLQEMSSNKGIMSTNKHKTEPCRTPHVNKALDEIPTKLY